MKILLWVVKALFTIAVFVGFVWAYGNGYIFIAAIIVVPLVILFWLGEIIWRHWHNTDYNNGWEAASEYFKNNK